MPVFDLEPGQPALFVGPMRSGKSNLVAWLLEPLSSVVVIDSKCHPDEWARWGRAHGYEVSDDPTEISRAPRLVHQVAMPTLLDVAGWRRPGSPGSRWTEALERLMRRGNTTVVFDETVHQLPAGRPHPSAMQIYTQGAAFGLSPWGGTQFANRIETATLRAAVHCFCFRLNPYDLRLLGERRGLAAEPLGNLDPYQFGYHLTNTDHWQVCRPVPKVF